MFEYMQNIDTYIVYTIDYVEIAEQYLCIGDKKLNGTFWMAKFCVDFSNIWASTRYCQLFHQSVLAL